jgi:hypothetical protein
MPRMENPATLAACGVPVGDQADGSINPDNSHSSVAPQANIRAELTDAIVWGKAETTIAFAFRRALAAKAVRQ